MTDAEWNESGLNEYHAFDCAFCGEENEVFVDEGLLSGGSRCQLTEDCAICCRPNLITIALDRDGSLLIDVTQEY